ncbi:MAG: prepilin peptidase [Candidatus Caldatribacteriaceae bacterium]
MTRVFFILVLFLLSYFDLKTHRIPDFLTLILYGLGVVSLFSSPPVFSHLLGGGMLFSFFLLLYLLKPQGVGFGDVKLSGAIGFFLGLELGLLALFLAFASGGVVGALLLLLKKKTLRDPLPFGPFLSAGATVALFWGQKIFSWYWNFFLFS